MGKPAGVLMFLLVILKVLGTAATDCWSCSATSCDCWDEGLTSVPQDLPTTITRLNLRENRITTLSQSDFSRYRSLETLGLDVNDISTINNQAFYHLSNLISLDLSYNCLTTLRPDMFTGLGNLENLDLRGNDISDIQAGTFDHTPQLRTLNLRLNRLTILRAGMFTGLGNLEQLELQNNDISDIQAGTFNSTPQLRILDLYNNSLTSFISSLNPMPQLRTLHLYYNKLTTLRSDMFTGLGNLEGLYLYNNNISDIQAGTFDTTPQLRELWLVDNKLTILRADMFTGLGNLERLHLDIKIDNNPWQCDCRMVDFRLKMTGSHPFENQINCSQPDNFYGQKLIDINPTDLICEAPTIAKFQTIVNIPLVQGSINLFCEASGIPTPDITVTLPSGLNTTVLSVGRVTVDVNGNIVIRNATSADVGLYTCIAANLVGSTFARLSIDVVYEEPTIVRFNSVNTLVQEETLRLVCEASGIPTPDITVILPSGQHATADMNGIITVTDVTAADAGLYVCIATNLAGSTFSTLVVDLQTVPTVTLPVLLGAVCGSIAGTVIIGGIILTIWCKRNNQSPHKGPDFSVVYNNTNTTATIVTNGQDLTVPTETMSGSSDAKDTHLVPRPASSQFKP
ncbi:PREDICTED: leucine-rich repeat-containing protein 4C-like [Branchiostoma belcheri]|uniref:Leucine-rich repeat-containing protein 4C-like n=1 Tax=Branchiostoma belcheri TaxID=7741 RepID=A0A6P4YGM7_BRABE|nr:PREDICTED: leucine-rich repeat-containing protein 4C-like [Branchiostoma belcheri]